MVKLFELVLFPAAIVGLFLTYSEAQTSNAQMQLALETAREQRAETARALLFDQDQVDSERLRGLSTLWSMGGLVLPPDLGCSDDCEVIEGFRAVGPLEDPALITDLKLTDRAIWRSHMANATLEGAFWIGARIRMSELANITFDNAILVDVGLLYTRLHDVTFRNSTLEGVSLETATLENVAFQLTDISGMRFCGAVNEGGVTISRCVALDNVDFSNSLYDETNPPVGLEQLSVRPQLGWVCPEGLAAAVASAKTSPVKLCARLD